MSLLWTYMLVSSRIDGLLYYISDMKLLSGVSNARVLRKARR
jgi:hypothetical protein